MSQLAVIISNILGRNILVKYVKSEEYATSSVALAKLGPEFAKLWATTYEGLKKGECAVVDPLLEEILGRRPKDMQTILTELLKSAESAKGSIDQYAK